MCYVDVLLVLSSHPPIVMYPAAVITKCILKIEHGAVSQIKTEKSKFSVLFHLRANSIHGNCNCTCQNFKRNLILPAI